MARLKTGPKVVIAAIVVGAALYGANMVGLFDKMAEQSQVQAQSQQLQPVQQQVQQPVQQQVQQLQPVQVQAPVPQQDDPLVVQEPATQNAGLSKLLGAKK